MDGFFFLFFMKNDEKSKQGGLSLLPAKLREINPDEYSGLKRLAVKCIKVVAIIIKDFLDDRCPLHASALSFTTILSLVPFFALAFAILKGFGVHTSLEPFIIEKLAVGSPEIVDRIVTYIDNTKMGSVGAVGLAALIVTVITLLGNIEEAFNDIWNVQETRSFKRKFSDYLSVVISGPLLLFAATSLTTSLQSQDFVKWLLGNEYFGPYLLLLFKLIPYLSIWVALVFLYIFIPNTKVRFMSALIGGILAGTTWQLAQWGYILFQVNVAKYNAIYGTLSALPVLMVWIYTSWLIVLLGVEIVCAHQNKETYFTDIRRAPINFATREMVALLVLLATGESYYRDGTPWTSDRLAEELGVPVRVVKEVLAQLVDEKYLVAAEGENPVYYLARALEHMNIAVLLGDLKNHGDSFRIQGMTGEQEIIGKLFAQLKDAVMSGNAALTMHDLVTAALRGKDVPLDK